MAGGVTSSLRLWRLDSAHVSSVFDTTRLGTLSHRISHRRRKSFILQAVVPPMSAPDDSAQRVSIRRKLAHLVLRRICAESVEPPPRGSAVKSGIWINAYPSSRPILPA